MGRCVAQGLSEAGANQYSFLESQGAHNTSSAVLGAGNTNVHWPVFALKELTDEVEDKAGYKPAGGRVGRTALLEGLAPGGLPKRGDVAVHLAG